MRKKSYSPILSTWLRVRSATRRKRVNFRSMSVSIPISDAASPPIPSTCTLYLPLRYVGPSTAPKPAASSSTKPVHVSIVPAVQERPIEQIPDDRLEILPGDSILLIVEDDPHYARIMVDLAREKGFKVLVAARGTDALELAKQYQPTAVSLDVFLPDMLGWSVLSQLKQNPLTRHIPV